MAELNRKYSQKTVKVLFALSGNQCAHPDCKNTVIEPATEQSEAHVSAQICHIYAISKDGPRGRTNLTQDELNSPDNLILLCRHHHGIIDGQHESYPASLLKEWKQAHQEKTTKALAAELGSVEADLFSHPYFPTVLVDQKIDEELELLRKKRFFAEFDTTAQARIFGNQLANGELSVTKSVLRSKALAWCARLLARSPELETAEHFLALSKKAGTSDESSIAEAFILSQKGKKEAALKRLAAINSASAFTAAFMVALHHDGAEGAFLWLDKTGRSPEGLDSDGKFILLANQLNASKWEAAHKTFNSLSDSDLSDTPALKHQSAIACLVRAVPEELRSGITKQLPFDTANFPLASDASSMIARIESLKHFQDAAETARKFDCENIASLSEEYALWMELRNPSSAEQGFKRLESKLRDPYTALRLVPFGVHFGIKLDLDAVEKSIEQKVALHGGSTFETAAARLALAFTRKSSRDVADYIERHFEDLSRHVDEFSLAGLQIEALCKAGFPIEAEHRLSILMENGLSSESEVRLRRMIAESNGADAIELRKQQFEETSALIDLQILVQQLEARQKWDEICHYGRLLFKQTQSISDAELYAAALTNAHRNTSALQFLEDIPELRSQSNKLRMYYCWALFHQGELLEARSELAEVQDESIDANYRALTLNLAIASGDWPSITAHVASEYQERDNRNAAELIQLAQLAHHLGSPLARNLTFDAASKGAEDPRVLAAAYHLAASAGWEGEEAVSQWMQMAAELSGDDGPIQKMTLQDLIERKPDWDRREADMLSMLGRGDCPMFIAGKALNRTLADLMLFGALSNLSERDPRRRSLVPAYSGRRPRLSIDNKVTIGIDATALITLSILNILDEALETFDAIVIPHSTLFWLFEEKQKAAFHQPSRIKEALKFRNVVASGALTSLPLSGTRDDNLAVQVDDDLAGLLSEATKTEDKLGPQKIVVRPSPVYKTGSLMDEEADLTHYAGVISSCLSIAEKLRKKGQITAEQIKRARAYFQVHEKAWPEQPVVKDGAILYLDDITVSYFLHLGLLDKLKAAGFTAVVPHSKVREFDALISFGDISEEVNEAIERIRASLNERIESGKVRVARQLSDEKRTAPEIGNHPTLEVLTLAGECDALLVDDRYINQNQEISGKTGSSPVFSTTDLLDHLAAVRTISCEQVEEHKTLLRRACYFAVPISEDELNDYLSECTISDSMVNETAELRAVRENLLRVRMSDWLQLPKEAQWLHQTVEVFINVLKNQWNQDIEPVRSRALSNWLVRQIDVRGWAHRFENEQVADDIVSTQRGAQILSLFLPPAEVSDEVKNNYWEWLDQSLLYDIEQQFPKLYDWIMENQKAQLSHLVERTMNDGFEI